MIPQFYIYVMVNGVDETRVFISIHFNSFLSLRSDGGVPVRFPFHSSPKWCQWKGAAPVRFPVHSIPADFNTIENSTIHWIPIGPNCDFIDQLHYSFHYSFHYFIYVMVDRRNEIGILETSHSIVFLRVFNEMETCPWGSHFIVFLRYFNEMEQHRRVIHFIVFLRGLNEMDHRPFHCFPKGFECNFIIQIHYSFHICNFIYVMVDRRNEIGILETSNFIVFLRGFNEMETCPWGARFIVFLRYFNEMEQHRRVINFIVFLRVLNEMDHRPFHCFPKGFECDFIIHFIIHFIYVIFLYVISYM